MEITGLLLAPLTGSTLLTSQASGFNSQVRLWVRPPRSAHTQKLLNGRASGYEPESCGFNSRLLHQLRPAPRTTLTLFSFTLTSDTFFAGLQGIGSPSSHYEDKSRSSPRPHQKGHSVDLTSFWFDSRIRRQFEKGVSSLYVKCRSSPKVGRSPHQRENTCTFFSSP